MTTVAKKKADSKRRLTPKQWAEAETLWALGDMTMYDLGRKFGVNEQTIYMHMSRKKIARGSKAEEHAKKVAEEVAKASVDDATITAARIRETKEEHYKMAAGLAKLAWAEILTAKQNKAPFASVMNNLKSLDSAVNIIAKARQERWAVLGLDRADFVDEDGLPELLISELTAEQIQELRDRDSTEFDELSDDDLQGEEAIVEES